MSMSERSAANTSSARVPAKQRAGLDQRDEAARGDVDALEHALEIVPHLAHQPVALAEQRVVIEHAWRVALGAEHDEADLRLVGAQVQDGVLQLARERERPERGALLVRCGDGRRARRSPARARSAWRRRACGRSRRRRANRRRCRRSSRRSSGGQRDAFGVARPVGARRELARACRDRLDPFRIAAPLRRPGATRPPWRRAGLPRSRRTRRRGRGAPCACR